MTDIHPDSLNLGEGRTLRFVAGETVGDRGRFELVRQLGQGGMGIVWLAKDTRLKDRPTALKFLPHEMRLSPTALVELREETLKARELSHPRIIRIHDLHDDKGEAFISMEFVNGATLSSVRMRNPGRFLTWPMLEPLVAQLCDALDYAHSKRIIHRDLKPGNVMLDEDGCIKLADFGISRSLSDLSHVTQRQQGTSGTPAYMSPQQMEGKTARTTDDIYSLGATIYEMLTSKPPFHTGNFEYQVVNVVPPPMTERLEDLELSNPIPVKVEQIVAACLLKDAKARPQTAREVAEALGLRPIRGSSSSPGIGLSGAGSGHDSGFGSERGSGRISSHAHTPAYTPYSAPISSHSSTPSPPAFVPPTEEAASSSRISGVGHGYVPPPVPVPVTTATGVMPERDEEVSLPTMPSTRASHDKAGTAAQPLATAQTQGAPVHMVKGSFELQSLDMVMIRRVLIVLAIAFTTILSVTGAGWWYFIHVPAERARKAAEVKQQEEEVATQKTQKKAEDDAKLAALAQQKKEAEEQQAREDILRKEAEAVKAKADKEAKIVADKEESERLLKAGEAYYNPPNNGTPDYNLARDSLLKAIDLGNIPALILLGKVYLNGLKQNDKAVEYFQMALEKGDDTATFNLGMLYLNSRPPDYRKGLDYLQKACDSGSSEAHYELASIYHYGRGEIKPNLEKAREHYEFGASRNEGLGLYGLGKLARLAKDDVTARFYLEKAAAKNISFAQYDMGTLYLFGQAGVKPDYAKALEYFKSSAANHNSYALNQLGDMYFDGTGGVKQDYIKAREYYEEAGKLGAPGALARLGLIYQMGRGVPKDNAKALEYFIKAADIGSADGAYRAGMMYHSGQGVPQDADKAFKYLDAVKGSNPEVAALLKRSYAGFPRQTQSQNPVSLNPQVQQNAETPH